MKAGWPAFPHLSQKGGVTVGNFYLGAGFLAYGDDEWGNELCAG